MTRILPVSVRCALIATLFLGLACGGSAPETPDAADPIARAIAATHRSEANVPRDVYRHPAETLAFFGLEGDMTVIEALPGGLWYGEILAPILREDGRYVAAAYDIDLPDQPEYRTRGYTRMVERFANEPEVFGTPGIAKLSAPTSIDLGEPGSADMVLTFRSTHGWVRDDAAEAVYAAFFEVLKSGGTLGVVQHRAGSKTDTSPGAFNGYVPEDRVIEIATGAGFVLDARSEVNANPKDEANYPDGVWTLPPSLTLKDQDRERYLAIGESDRMTLRFKKP
jgi:predicted methyltransferase